MLEGKTVNLRVLEKEDVLLLVEWFSKQDFWGEYIPLGQPSRGNIEKSYDKELEEGGKLFFIEKKDGTKVGFIHHFLLGNLLEIGYALLPTERGKGYCTESAKVLVDYLFLSRDIPCIQATTDIRNAASQKVLEKVGFKKEGILRKRWFMKGEWKDIAVFSILREEWKEPKIIGH